ncbi:unnamed protein product, partial [marine sediment metagenome]
YSIKMMGKKKFTQKLKKKLEKPEIEQIYRKAV